VAKNHQVTSFSPTFPPFTFPPSKRIKAHVSPQQVIIVALPAGRVPLNLARHALLHQVTASTWPGQVERDNVKCGPGAGDTRAPLIEMQ